MSMRFDHEGSAPDFAPEPIYTAGPDVDLFAASDDLQAFADSWQTALEEAEPPIITDPDEQEDGGAEFGPHDCREEEVEKSTYPTRSGNITAWTECEVCGGVLTPPYHDTIL
jgi:hypothetical protein